MNASVLLQLLVTIGSAYLGAYLGARKFVREKRWEARSNAYRDIVEAVHKISFWTEQHYAAVHFLPTVGRDKLKELAESYESAREELWRYSEIGELYISEDAKKEITEFRDELEEAAHFYEEDRNPDNEREVFSHFCELIRKSIQVHLPVIIRLAKADLEGSRVVKSMRLIPGRRL